MAKCRAIVFDVGGTLVYPAEPVGETYARFARPHGAKLNAEATMAAFRVALKTKAPRVQGSIPTNGDDRTWWQEIVRASISDRTFLESPKFETFFEEVYLYFGQPEAWELFPEVTEVLHALRDHPVELVALSNWDARLHAVLDGLGIGEFLSRRFISAELGWEKADPAIYRHVEEHLRLPASVLLSVGDDQPNDVDAPREAGWQAVHIDRPTTDLWAVVRALSGGKKERGKR